MSPSSTKNSPKPKSSEGPPLLPPLLYPVQGTSEKRWMKQLKDEGRIRAIAPRLYTSVPESQVQKVVRSSWSEIISRLYPQALLSHRSALEFHPSDEHRIYLTSTTNRKVELPGLTLEFIRGPGPLEDDLAFMGFHASSLARALLENFSASTSTHSRVLSSQKIEERLENHLHVKGEAELNAVRDRARAIAAQLGWQNEFKKLDQMMGAILGTRPAAGLTSPRAQARSLGRPFDPACNERLEVLFAQLKTQPLIDLREASKASDHFTNKAFFEAYFSNYIEGTTFEIEEAEEIVFDQRIPEKRPKDAHDILGTYNIVSNPNEIKKCPTSPEELETLLKSRHGTLMEARPEVGPGLYKEKPNRAGDTHFVHPDFVEGTLERGFLKYQELPKGLARAIFMMFLVAEVHPFNDGNGRIARIMMNAELYSEGLSTIIIPNVYREDYITALKALSKRDRPDPLVRMLSRAYKFSNLEFSPYKKILKELESRNWFREPKDAKIIEG